MLQPCVRSMVCRRRVGGGERSSEIIHWIMGSTPVGVYAMKDEGSRVAGGLHVPQRPQSARALLMVLASFASRGATELVG